MNFLSWVASIKILREVGYKLAELKVTMAYRKLREVVKYAMNRNMSPTMVAEYETKLINKSLLQQKLQEMTLLMEDIEQDEPESE